MPGAWVGKVQPSNSGSACIDTDTGAQSFLNSTCDRVLNQVRPYLGYFAVDALRTIFSSNYNSLQVKTTKRFRGKSYIDANYTWSRDLTNAQADYSGFAKTSTTSTATTAGPPSTATMSLPSTACGSCPGSAISEISKGRLIGGWEISGIYSMNSGLPLTISASSAFSPSYNLSGGRHQHPSTAGPTPG